MVCILSFDELPEATLQNRSKCTKKVGQMKPFNAILCTNQSKLSFFSDRTHVVITFSLLNSVMKAFSLTFFATCFRLGLPGFRGNFRAVVSVWELFYASWFSDVCACLRRVRNRANTKNTRITPNAPKAMLLVVVTVAGRNSITTSWLPAGTFSARST